MIVIADSGSTKTEWRLCTRDKIQASVQTAGLNPLALDKGATISELQDSELVDWQAMGVTEVHFYGAGIVNDNQGTIASGNLQNFFRDAEVEVNSDLLGAARAVFGDESGIIGILGTGSNTGFYDGNEITIHIPALGYILADEGSGAVLGKNLIRNFLRNELPDDLNKAFKEYYLDYESLIENVYSQRHASRFLASFVPFLHEHRGEQLIKELVLSELNKFIKLIRSYPGYHKIGIVGSVGFKFQTELNLLANNAELNIVRYLKNPIEKLAEYHLSKLK